MDQDLDFVEFEGSDHSDESKNSPGRNIYTKIFVGGLNPITSNGKFFRSSHVLLSNLLKLKLT